MHLISKLISPATTCLLVALLLQGCVTSKKYRLSKTETEPTALGWSVASPPLTLTLQSLIVFKGPGSWKREARWDEYVLRLSNDGTQPVTINAAGLVDLLDTAQLPGDDPWPLERLSYTNWDKYGKSGLKLVAGAGAVVLYAGVVVTVASESILGGAAAGGAVAFLDLVPVVAAVDITAVAIMNHQNKEKVQAEFQRRRLALPLTVAPGSSATGSLFFPMVPGPKRLTLTGKISETPVELTLDLKPLAGLHLKSAAKNPAP